MNKAVPWSLCVVLLVVAAGIYVYFQRELGTKDAALQAAETRYTALKAEAAAKEQSAARQLQEANDRVLAASAKAAEIATDAGARLAQQRAEADAKLQAASLPQTPIAVSFRKAMLGGGGVAVIRSIASASLPLVVVAERPGGPQKRFEFVIDPGAVKELGHVEGWAFVPGDSIQVQAPNHKAVRVLAP